MAVLTMSRQTHERCELGGALGASNLKKISRPDQIRVSQTEQLLPDAERSGIMFARFGYSISEAVADLVDNSIDAEATKVLVRFVRTDERIARVLIADDGLGMSDGELSEAMRFGSKSAKSANALGKYGFGLKTASLSQARVVTVLSRSKGRSIGRRWTRANIGQGWQCEILNHEDVAQFFDQDYAPLGLNKSGTIVIWEDLEHLKAPSAKIDSVLHRTQQKLQVELGLRFHRFLSPAEQFSIILDRQVAGEMPSGIKLKIEPLNPFAYPRPATKAGYPKTFSIELAPYGPLTMDCHIWPSKSEDRGYKLGGGKVSARQGFYFYRNDRLIQAGGWNGCREDDNEPHLSLARVKIDLPAAFDDAFKLNVMKSHVEPPPAFAPMVKAAANRGATFQEYINDALSVYGKTKKKEAASFRYAPGRGFPAGSRQAAAAILREEGTGRIKSIGFSWKKLAPTEFVTFDRESRELVLNQDYRAAALQSRKASSADAPLVKLLLLFLFQDEFDRKFSSARSRDWLERMNHAITSTLKREG